MYKTPLSLYVGAFFLIASISLQRCSRCGRPDAAGTPRCAAPSARGPRAPKAGLCRHLPRRTALRGQPGASHRWPGLVRRATVGISWARAFAAPGRGLGAHQQGSLAGIQSIGHDRGALKQNHIRPKHCVPSSVPLPKGPFRWREHLQTLTSLSPHLPSSKS